jgi:antitoxin VapB
MYIPTWNTSMTRTTVSQTNRSQAVRLPKGVAFPAKVREVTILRDGPRRITVPAHLVWYDLFDSPGIDIGEREQPPVQRRESFRRCGTCWTRISIFTSCETRPTGGAARPFQSRGRHALQLHDRPERVAGRRGKIRQVD